jgi:hypothetical protein
MIKLKCVTPKTYLAHNAIPSWITSHYRIKTLGNPFSDKKSAMTFFNSNIANRSPGGYDIMTTVVIIAAAIASFPNTYYYIDAKYEST